MEALAIGLAAYGVVVTFYAVKWCEIAKGWRRVAGKYEKAADGYREKYLQAREQIAPFDHDGDGKPGGSKPRGKG